MKSCEEYQALIEMYLDSELTREQKHLFETHISSCNECRDALSFSKSIRQTLTTLPEIDVPEDFNLVLKQRINAECKSPKKTFSIYARKYGALAACVILAVVIGGGLSEFDFTKSGEEYDNFVTEATPVPTLVPETAIISLEQNAGEKTPTKDRKTDNESVPSPTSAEVTTNASAIDTDTAPANEYQEESVPQVAALDITDDTPTTTPEIPAADGDNSSSERAAQVSVTPTVTLTVSAEHTLGALTLAEEFATAENGIYTADKTSFDKMLEAFEIGGINYISSGTADGEVIIFTIYTE